MRIRDFLAGLGVAVGLVGLGIALSPGVAGTVDLTAIPIQFVGFAAIVIAILGYMARRRAEFPRGDPPSVEEWPELGRPGSDVDAALAEATVANWVGHSRRRELRERLFETAIEVLRATEGCDRERAIEILGEGTWTDDRRAVALFADEPPPTPIEDVVRGLLSGRSQFAVQASHVIQALRERMEDNA